MTSLIEADTGRINQVISNLSSDTSKFTKTDSISGVTEKRDTEVDIGIKDAGTGIDPETLPSSLQNLPRNLQVILDLVYSNRKA